MSATADRLADYYPFPTEVIETVAEVAERQAEFEHYADLLEDSGVHEPEIYEHNDRQYSIVDIRPDEYDPAEATLVRLAMANPLDPNQRYQLATIAAANPNRRIIATGNPSGGSYKTGVLSSTERKVVGNGSLLPVSEPLRTYGEKSGVERINEVGYSYGAAVAATGMTNWDVSKLVAIEPVVGKRSLVRLGLDFASTAKSLSDYVDASGLETFKTARKDSVTAMQYNRGLARLTNLAVARALTKPEFFNDLKIGLAFDTDLSATVAWGTESELAVNGLMNNFAEIMGKLFDQNRFAPIPLEGHKHALANDVHLQAAIVRHGLGAAA